MKLTKYVAIAAATLLLVGCTVPTDSYVSELEQTVVESTSLEPTGELTSGCVGFYLICTQPSYGMFFFAPANSDVGVFCTESVAVIRKLGAVAYSAMGGDAYRLPADSAEIIEMCSDGLAKPLEDTYGPLYQGISFYDDGAKDQIGKYYGLAFRDDLEPKGFYLEVSFSRDLGRVGYVIYGNEKPKLMTQEDLDSANQANEIVAETMKVANPLLGHPEAEAIKKIEDAGYTWVIIDRDGKELTHDETYTPTRIRLTIREGMIYDAVAG